MAERNEGRRGRRAPLAKEDKRSLNKESRQRLRRIFSYVKPYRAYFIFGMLFMGLSTGSLMLFPYLAGKMLDVAQGQGGDFPLTTVSEVGLALIGVFVLQAMFAFSRSMLMAQVSERSMADLRKDVFGKMIALPLTFYDKRRTGELISRITSDASTLYDLFSVNLAELIRQVIVLLFGVTALLVLSPQLTGFMLATFPILVVLALVFGRFIRKRSKETQDKLAETNVIVEETLQAIHTVKSFTSEIWELMRYRKAMDGQVSLAIKTAWYRSGFISLSPLMLFLGIAAVLWYGATLMEAGEVTYGSIFSFVTYTVFIGGSMAGFSNLYASLQRAIGSSERVLDILKEDVEPTIVEEPPMPIKLEGHIQYKDVHFSYPTREDIEVLKGISIEIPPGEKAALVGHSGAGKSTIVQLLMRFYPISQGQILVDDQPLDDFQLRSFREQIGVVPQEVLLFGGSIRENIGYGKPGASDEEIREAARKANALQFIEGFPEGMETLVGERGVKLSGGQRQRIAIARAILKDPAILILDEATSSLDAESESLVQEALEELMRNRTTIIIAHRLGTIRKADRIYVLDQGQIIESGTHEELLTRDNGTYTNLVKLQLAD